MQSLQGGSRMCRETLLCLGGCQVSSQLKGLVLLSVGLPAAWERVAQLDFGSRPGEQPSRKLYIEVMAK
jgi:hypothetical protein